MKFVRDNFATLTIIALLLFLYMKGVFKAPPPASAPTIIIHIDSQVHQVSSTVPYQPLVINTTAPRSVPATYAPDTSYLGLVRQYQALVQSFLSTSLVRDSLKIDSIGYVALSDSISQNKILSRSWNAHIINRIITREITTPAPLKRTLYWGSEITLYPYPVPGLSHAEVALLFKGKNNHILGAGVGLQFPAFRPTVSLKYYQPF